MTTRRNPYLGNFQYLIIGSKFEPEIPKRGMLFIGSSSMFNSSLSFHHFGAIHAFFVTTPTTTQPQHKLNTVVGLDTKMTLHTSQLYCSFQEPQINIY